MDHGKSYIRKTKREKRKRGAKIALLEKVSNFSSFSMTINETKVREKVRK